MTKKIYTCPTVEILYLDSRDIIATSTWASGSDSPWGSRKNDDFYFSDEYDFIDIEN